MSLRSSSQKGSVLVYILVAVMLFAALAMAVSKMMRGSSNIGEEKAGVQTSEVLEYARALRESIQAMKISNGCEDEQISLERSPFDGTDPLYVNDAAPKSLSCHLFHPQGGGANYQDHFDGREWRFTASYNIADVGSEAPDLVATLIVKSTVCSQINERLGVDNAAVQKSTPLSDGADETNMLVPFKGQFSGSAQITASEYRGKMAGCYLSASSNGNDYTFYQVLIAH